jgi:hypothetical protein
MAGKTTTGRIQVPPNSKLDHHSAQSLILEIIGVEGMIFMTKNLSVIGIVTDHPCICNRGSGLCQARKEDASPWLLQASH